MMHAPPAGAEGEAAGAEAEAYGGYFAGKSRRWELRVQGRFLRRPRGQLYMGVVMMDYDHSQEPSIFMQTLASVAVPIVEGALGQRLHFAWGSRGEAAGLPDAELMEVVTSLAGFDQVIVTPAGKTPPPLTGDLGDLGLVRAKMPSAAFHEAVQELTEGISTEDTYTFCLWGISSYVDLLTGSAVGLLPFRAVTWREPTPLHLALYALEPEAEDDTRHLERHKFYYMDLMLWTSAIQCPGLPAHYAFHDPRPREQPAEAG